MITLSINCLICVDGCYRMESLDMNSFYVPVTFEFDNKAVIPVLSWRSFAEKPWRMSLSAPVSALIEGSRAFYLAFIRLDEEGYKKQWVTLGANNGSEVQILSGLKPGDEGRDRGGYLDQGCLPLLTQYRLIAIAINRRDVAC